jgi:hypothetical protein
MKEDAKKSFLNYNQPLYRGELSAQNAATLYFSAVGCCVKFALLSSIAFFQARNILADL